MEYNQRENEMLDRKDYLTESKKLMFRANG
jgi:hypothetical protein